MPPQVPLNLENLKQLDFGKIGAAFTAEITHVTKDCMDRPQDDKVRKVTISFLLKPVINKDSMSTTIDLDSIDVGCEITSSVPKRRTQIYNMSPKQDGQLVFHPDNARDANESTLYDDAEPKTIDPVTGEEKTAE